MTTMTTFHTAKVNNQKVFYREAGPKNAPVILLLHGFPSSSHMFRDLIPRLANTYRVIAPDMMGFGFTDAPDRTEFSYTFENLTDVIDSFTQILDLESYALYLFDYGAPVGLRLACRHPEKVTAIISQNGNAYVEGLSDAWSPIRKYWEAPTNENRDALRSILTPETTQWQYTHGVANTERVAPDGYTLDNALMARPGNFEIQLDLFLDYANNLSLYPEFQEYFRSHRPPLLAVWGKNDPFFLPPGADAFKRDLPDAEIKFFDTGHFALETHHAEIAIVIQDFLTRIVSPFGDNEQNFISTERAIQSVNSA